MCGDYSPFDFAASFIVVMIGASEAVNMAGVFFHRPLSDCVLAFVFLSAGGVLALTGLTLWYRRKKNQNGMHAGWKREEAGLLVLLLLLIFSQLFFQLKGRWLYLRSDMTMETVGAFLQTDSIYGVDPLTGTVPETDMPSRLKLICLPTLYAILCKLFHATPSLVVWKAAPAVVLVGCYCAYACLGRSLFPEKRAQRLLFLVVVAILFWAEAATVGMDGFCLLTSGWRGASLRNLVLIPYAISLSLRKKYFHALLVCMAETCIIWTTFGVGACAAVTIGIWAVAWLKQHMPPRKEDDV